MKPNKQMAHGSQVNGVVDLFKFKVLVDDLAESKNSIEYQLESIKKKLYANNLFYPQHGQISSDHLYARLSIANQ